MQNQRIKTKWFVTGKGSPLVMNVIILRYRLIAMAISMKLLST